MSNEGWINNVPTPSQDEMDQAMRRAQRLRNEAFASAIPWLSIQLKRLAGYLRHAIAKVGVHESPPNLAGPNRESLS